MSTRRSPGTGSVYYDKSTGRWVGTYEAGWTTRGTRRRRKITGRTETETRRRLAAKMRETTPGPDTPSSTTLKRWADTWLEITSSRRRPTTWRANRAAVTTWITPTIGHKRLDRLTPGDVRALHKAILDAGRGPSSAIRTHAVLTKMLKDAILEGHAIPQAVLLVEAPEAAETDRDAIPTDHAIALIQAATGTPDESRWVAAFLQGLRPAEALGLTWECVNLDTGVLDISWQLQALPYKTAWDRSSGFRIPTGYTARQLVGSWHLVRPKTSSGQRLAVMGPFLAAALSTWQQNAPTSPHGLVWPGADGGPRKPHRDGAAFRALQDAAGVRHRAGRYYVPHETRHTTATLLREAGYDDTTITAIMGHASILSTKAYLHAREGRKREAAEALASRLGIGAAAVRQVEP